MSKPQTKSESKVETKKENQGEKELIPLSELATLYAKPQAFFHDFGTALKFDGYYGWHIKVAGKIVLLGMIPDKTQTVEQEHKEWLTNKKT